MSIYSRLDRAEGGISVRAEITEAHDPDVRIRLTEEIHEIVEIIDEIFLGGVAATGRK